MAARRRRATVFLLPMAAALFILSAHHSSSLLLRSRSIINRRFAPKMSSSSSIPPLSSSAPPPPRRIFCYGDSLTAGTSPPSFDEFPYGPHLERELNAMLQGGGKSAIVRWRGLPGWTASAMVDSIDDPRAGLRPVLEGIRDPSLSLVIVLAGTNDIGAMTSSMIGGGGGGQIDADSAASPILRLHDACLEKVEGVRTLAVGIPGSAWQEMNPVAKKLCEDVNDVLRKYASAHRDDGRVSYADFPFPFRKGDPRWCGDGLHLSSEGYAELGKALAPRVKDILSFS